MIDTHFSVAYDQPFCCKLLFLVLSVNFLGENSLFQIIPDVLEV